MAVETSSARGTSGGVEIETEPMDRSSEPPTQEMNAAEPAATPVVCMAGTAPNTSTPVASERSSPQIPLPVSKRHRPWKPARTTPSSALRKTPGMKLSWERKMAMKEKRQALAAAVRAAREADQEAKDAERRRRYEKRKRKEENELKSAKKVPITNPKKLRQMSKKQFLHHVHSGKK